jgi:hypothetical protein
VKNHTSILLTAFLLTFFISSFGQKPVVNAGRDTTLFQPANSIMLQGQATPTGGNSIKSYYWTKIKGSKFGIIDRPYSATTNFYNLATGTYYLQLTASQSNRVVGVDTIIINVDTSGVVACNTNPPVIYHQSVTESGEIFLNGALWRGGDTVYIDSSHYTGDFTFKNIHGDPCHYITIINNGYVNPQGISFSNCSYIHITGTGNTRLPYGFAAFHDGFAVNMSDHFEIDHIDLSSVIGVGLYIKTQPDSTIPGSYWIEGSDSNYVMNKYYIHHNRISNSLGESMYLGDTAPDGNQVGNLLPLRMDSVEVAFNYVDSSGWDGIQLSCARDGCSIHDNIVKYYGLQIMGNQGTGILFGSNTRGNVYNNTVLSGFGVGIQMFGYGSDSIYNNYVDSAGLIGSIRYTPEAIQSNDTKTLSQPNPPQQLFIYSNVIKYPAIPAVYVLNDNNNSLAATCHDNIFCIPGASGGWQSTYIQLDPAGSTQTNNTLNCSP